MTIDKATVEEDWPRLKERLIDKWGAFILLYSFFIFFICRFACIFEAGGLSFEYYSMFRSCALPPPFLKMTSKIVSSCGCLLHQENTGLDVEKMIFATKSSGEVVR